MRSTITRRHALSALAAGSAVAIAGCGSDETTNDSEPPTSNGDDGTDSETKNGEQEVREPRNVLLIAADKTHVIDAAETYDAVEIEPNGVLVFEPGGCLEFEPQIDA